MAENYLKDTWKPLSEGSLPEVGRLIFAVVECDYLWDEEEDTDPVIEEFMVTTSEVNHGGIGFLHLGENTLLPQEYSVVRWRYMN